jgi:hypothetical protein
MIDVAMPIACQPIAISGRNLLFRRILTQAIRNDPDWQHGEYRSPPRHWLYTAPLWAMMLESAARLQLQAQAPTRQASLELYDRLVEEARRNFDANDLLYWVESSWDYDPQPDLANIKARVAAVYFADDAINLAELPQAEKLVRSIPMLASCWSPPAKAPPGTARWRSPRGGSPSWRSCCARQREPGHPEMAARAHRLIGRSKAAIRRAGRRVSRRVERSSACGQAERARALPRRLELARR